MVQHFTLLSQMTRKVKLKTMQEVGKQAGAHTTQETPSNIVGTTNAAARIKKTKNLDFELSKNDINSITRRQLLPTFDFRTLPLITSYVEGRQVYSSSRALTLLSQAVEKNRQLEEENWELKTQLRVAHVMLGKKLECDTKAFGVPPKKVVVVKSKRTQATDRDKRTRKTVNFHGSSTCLLETQAQGSDSDAKPRFII